MQSLEHFAQAPQESNGYQRNNTTIAPEIITYLKDECDLREFFVPKPMQGVLSKSFRIEKEEGVGKLPQILMKHILVTKLWQLMNCKIDKKSISENKLGILLT